jgi:cell wall-associated NlpC family hydrolase
VAAPRTVNSLNPSLLINLAAAVLLAFGVAPSQAQSWRSLEAVYSAQTVDGVPLQPFSFDRQPARAQAIQVAYYTSRPTRRVEPINHDEYDSETTTSGLDVGGSCPMVPGNRAVLRNGIAYVPANAPDAVKHAIWAINTIRNRPYVWGGGHGSFHDYGYDCSGTVSFALWHIDGRDAWGFQARHPAGL